jgi:hypothetical protein
MSVQFVEGSTESHNPVEKRCDRCGARGYVIARKLDMELVFCNHHGSEVTPKLQAEGWICSMTAME